MTQSLWAVNGHKRKVDEFMPFMPKEDPDPLAMMRGWFGGRLKKKAK